MVSENAKQLRSSWHRFKGVITILSYIFVKKQIKVREEIFSA